MISLKLQLILIIVSVICAVLLINLIRKYRLELKYTLLWLAMMVIVLVLSIFPGLISSIANLIGIELPVNALFLLVSFSAMVILFSMTVTTSKSTTKLKELTQEVGLLKLEVMKLMGEKVWEEPKK